MPTFDEIFKRWIDKNELTQEDIIPILMEYVQTFDKGEFNPQGTIAFIQLMNSNGLLGRVLENAIEKIAYKKQYHWGKVFDSKGQLLSRIWQPQDGKIQN